MIKIVLSVLIKQFVIVKNFTPLTLFIGNVLSKLTKIIVTLTFFYHAFGRRILPVKMVNVNASSEIIMIQKEKFVKIFIVSDIQ